MPSRKSNRKIDITNDAEHIIKMYKNGYSLNAISEKLNLNRYSIRKVLIENNLYQIISKNTKEAVISNYSDLILELYESGYSSKKIKIYLNDNKNTNIDLRVIQKVIKTKYPNMRSAKVYNKKYTCDENFFNDYTPESCYWGGFIMADGCVFSKSNNKQNNALTIGLSSKDEEHLKQFAKDVNYNGTIYHSTKIGFGKEAKSSTITITSFKLVEDLKKNFNIDSHKTYTCKPSNKIPHEFIPYFILGLIDGDGTISYYTTNTNRKQFSVLFTGTKEVCEYILNFYNKDIKLIQRWENRENINNYSFSLQGNIQLYQILSSMYTDKIIDHCLQRKYQKYLLLKEQYKIMYK